MIQFAASTHPGLKRDHNEDCYEADQKLGLWLVADGVGGHSYGEVASAIVKATVAEACARGETLVDAIHSAHSAVLAEIAQRDENLGMGSTVVACTIADDNYHVSWVGDSRAYLWNGRSLEQLTRDHTHVYDLVDQGIISIAEARTHPERHVLTQSIGVFDDMELQPGIVRGRFEQGQQILLCSDGLTDELSDPAIARQMLRNSPTESQVDSLVKAALAAGGRDNITVVLVGEAVGLDQQDESPRQPDMETTQDIGEAVTDSRQTRESFGRQFWIALAVIIALVFIAWI